MWKESYRLGIESIDAQHKKLFQMTEELLKAIDEKKGPEEFKKSILFLKEYVVVHFRDEEAYQVSIHYAGMAEHMMQHRMFTEEILSFEKQLEQSCFDLNVVKELAGTLTAWLIYHVADADQKIAGKGSEKVKQITGPYIDFFGESTKNVLVKMAGLDSANFHMEKRSLPQLNSDTIVSIDLAGGIEGSAVFGFSREFAVKLFEAMTFMVPEEVDGLVCSALAEISNIVCGNTATLLSQKGLSIEIKPPVISSGNSIKTEDMEGMSINTDLGDLELAIVR